MMNGRNSQKRRNMSMASRGLESRIRKLEARQALSRRRDGVTEVPCEPGQDIDEAAQALGLLDGLTGPIAFVPTTSASAEEWEASVTAELAWMAQHKVESAGTERPQINAAPGG
jgi:hypothetical protein